MDNSDSPKQSAAESSATRLSDQAERTRMSQPAASDSPPVAPATLARTLARPQPQQGEAEVDATRLAKTALSGNAATETDSGTRIQVRTPNSEAPLVKSFKQDQTRTLQAGISAENAKTTVANPDIPSRIIKQDSVFAQLDRRIAEQYADKKVLKQRFVLIKTLGSGGMGNVYLAKDLLREEMEDSSPNVAIKVLNDECRNLPGALQSLQREAKKAQALSHPNIVTVYDFDRDGDTAFITMEYIDGVELKDHLRKNKRMPHDKAMYVIDRVARGLAYAHQQGFAHADIKPANIFLGENGVVKILDFGIAKAFTEATKEKRSAADDLTEGALTPSYASLEMLQGSPALPSDDVYSLACMAYEMIRGRHPFVGDDGLPMPADVAKKKGVKPEVIPGLSRRHMNALRKGLEFESAHRFKDAGEFIDAIKPRNLKKDGILLASAAVITGIIIFVVNQGLDQVVPSVSSLKPELAQVAEAINDGDELLQSGDIDYAHRLYAQAWEVANDLTANDVDEREKAHSILQDRRNKVSEFLIDKSKEKGLDEYRLRELYVALEFLLKDDIGGNEKHIKRALVDIEARIKKQE